MYITSYIICILEQEEKKRRAIAYAEVSAEVKEQTRVVSIYTIRLLHIQLLLYSHFPLHYTLPIFVYTEGRAAATGADRGGQGPGQEEEGTIRTVVD